MICPTCKISCSYVCPCCTESVISDWHVTDEAIAFGKTITQEERNKYNNMRMKCWEKVIDNIKKLVKRI